MSAAPYKIVDRRGTDYANSNNLYEAAKVSHERKRVNGLHRDLHQTITGEGRNTLMDYGRWLFANFPTVHGMVLEQANLAVGSWIPQFDGEDKAWGEQAEDWLYNWHKICDIRGWPYDYETFTQLNVIAPIRDGDIGTLLVTNREGYPFLQLIPGHRIGSKGNERVVKEGRYDGARIVDGVILNDYGRAKAYRVWSRYAGQGEFTDISAQNMALTFYPKWPDQVRGLSDLAAGISNWKDIQETQANELLAQKAAASIALIEVNETGEADTAKSVIRTAATRNSDGDLKTPTYEELAGGTVRYFRANSGSSVTTLQHNRPGQMAMAFLSSCMRDAFQAAEWDYYFSVDPSKVGGASMRVIVDRINRVIKKRRRMVEKVCRRVDGWAISKAIELGLLPASEEWFKWEYQGPADVTADKKYDSDVDMQEYNSGWRTMQDICARRNLWWEDVQDQRMREEKREIERREEMGLPEKLPEEEAGSVPNRTPRKPDEDQGKKEDDDE